MRLLTSIIAVALVWTVGCQGGGGNGTSNMNPPVPSAVFSAGGLGLFAGEPAQIAIDIAAGIGPYMVAVDMGGGADNLPDSPAGYSSTHDFMLREGGPYTWTVMVTDANSQTGTATGTYGPVGPRQNHAPRITDIVFDDGMLIAAVDDPDDDESLIVSVSEVPGLVTSRLLQHVANETAALFKYKLLDGFSTESMAVEVTVSDGDLMNSTTVTPRSAIPSLELPAGALAAIPLLRSVAVGEPVPILVTAGDFPPEAPFAYMNGVGITVDSSAWQVDGSLNVGSVGGERKDVDGIYSGMSPLPSNFFIPEDFMMFPPGVYDDPDKILLGFNITPIGAGEVTAGGDLFNFAVEFQQEGAYKLGFLVFQDVKRTYYSDSEPVEYDWPDLSNDYPGVPNSITVE